MEEGVPGEMAQIETFYDELGLLQELLKTQKKKEASPFFPVDQPIFYPEVAILFIPSRGWNRREALLFLKGV